MNIQLRLLIVMMLFAPLMSKAQKSIELFNGKNLKGWYAYTKNGGVHKKADGIYTVENKMIRLKGKEVGYLISKKSFTNFKLTVDFKWNTDIETPKNRKRNSGVMYLVPKGTEDLLWPKGIQFQVKEGATGDFILLQQVTLDVKGKTVEPGKSVVSERFADAAKPTGEWNTITVTCVDGKIKQELNGTLVNEGSNSSVLEGRILLQYEGSPIDFRKVSIVKLP